MARVVLENVTKKYGDVLAVDHLNLEVRDKECLVLLGPSGCGKTTVLRMIAGLDKVTSGNIYIGDRRVTNELPSDRGITMIFQSQQLIPHMNAYDNMAFGLRVRKDRPFADEPADGGPTNDTASGSASAIRTDRRTRDVAIRKWIEQVASRMGLLPYLHFNPRQLSSGQRQRVVLGRAISREPQVYLMDEPLANLDATMRAAMRAELRNLHQRSGVTTIYVTHDQAEAMILGNRIAVMKDGVLQQIDTPQEL